MTEFGPIPVHEGDLVAGKYRIAEVIGVGGMGVVVAALHEQLDQRVAIKFVRGEALGNEEAVQRFLREGRAAAKLKSEHAARVLDVGTLDTGVPYMVMELLEGSDLAQALVERGPVPVDVAAEWVAQACEALAEAHAAGIVHRDLKPQNLFLARTVGGAARVKVLDFGVSKSIATITSGFGALTRTRAMLGSPLYMAPEQMRSSRDVDARADVWALGVVLFELLTQRWPFEAETLPALCLKVVSEPPQSLSELRPDIPATMVRIVERCLEKDVEKRFANAAEVASALEPLVPPQARAVVERARLAIASLPPTTPPLGSGKGVHERTTPSPRLSRRSPPTPAAWGSGGRAGRALKGWRGVVLWAGIGVLAVAGIAGGVVGLRRHPNDAPLPAAATSLAAEGTSHARPGQPLAFGTSSAKTLESSAASSIAVTALAPPPSESVPTAPSASASVKSAPSAVVASVVPVVNQAAPTPPAAAASRLPATGKPPARDDDIPALR
jgi:eukaryotic-like serine/threonine-protein kinase